MSTTALDVDSRERAPPSEQGVLDLAQYTLEQVRRDAELVLFRGLRSGHEEGSPSSILVQVPVGDPPSPAIVRSLQEDYNLRSELDPAYVVRSLSMVHDRGRPVVILEDPLGTPLDLLLDGAMDVAQFLRLAIRVAAALGHVHSRGLVHKDIKPAGVVEFLAKPFHDQDLLDVIHAAIERDRKRRREAIGLAELRERFATLTERERQIMTLVVIGRANKQIAAELSLSETTVKVHRG
jgi:hypothetical protein